TVNTDSLDLRVEEALYSDTSCLRTITDFIDDEISKIDFSECACDTCDTDTLTYCDSRKQLMLEDLIPGGQYCLYDEDEFFVTDSTSILRDYNGTFFYWQIPGTDYLNESGTPDTVTINGFELLPNELDVEEFVENFKTSWAEALLPY